MAKQDDYIRYTIRVPADLYERLKDSSGEKSINAEIISRLEKSLGPPSENDDERIIREKMLALIEEQQTILQRQAKYIDDIIKSVVDK